MKVFKFSDDETEWVAAESREQAISYFQNELDHEDDVDYEAHLTELDQNEMDTTTLSFVDDMGEENGSKSISEMIRDGELGELPTLLGATWI